MTLDVARLIVELLVLAVGLGYWGGEVKAKRQRGSTFSQEAPYSHSRYLTEELGRINRRLDEASRKSSETHTSTMTKMNTLELELRDLKRRLGAPFAST